MLEAFSKMRWKPAAFAIVCLAVPSAVVLIGTSSRNSGVAFSAGVLTFVVAFACAASRRVPVWIPWLGPLAIFAALRIVSHREHVAAGGGDDNGDLTDAASIVVLIFTTIAVAMAFWIRTQAPPSPPPD